MDEITGFTRSGKKWREEDTQELTDSDDLEDDLQGKDCDAEIVSNSESDEDENIPPSFPYLQNWNYVEPGLDQNHEPPEFLGTPGHSPAMDYSIEHLQSDDEKCDFFIDSVLPDELLVNIVEWTNTRANLYINSHDTIDFS